MCLLGTPWTVAYQAPLSVEFSRQGYRGGLPFSAPRDLPNPEMELRSLTSPALAGGFFTTSATWEAYTVLCFVAQSCPTLCNPVDCSPSGSSVHGDTPGKNTRVSCPPPGDLPNPRIESRSLALQVDFLLSEPPGKPKNTAVGSLSLLLGIFPT